jgi:hypothetical protein
MNSTPPPRRCACGGPAAVAEAQQALQALQAFEPAVALVDVAHQIVRWCSVRFNARTGLEPGDRVPELLARVPGVRGALDNLSAHPPRAARGGVCAVRVGAGLVAISLREPVDGVRGSADPRPHAATGCDRLVSAASALPLSETAATLAHEINQPLSVVVNVLQGIRLRLGALPAGCLPDTETEALVGSVNLGLEQARYAVRLGAPHRQARSAQPDLNTRSECLP